MISLWWRLVKVRPARLSNGLENVLKRSRLMMQSVTRGVDGDADQHAIDLTYA